MNYISVQETAPDKKKMKKKRDRSSKRSKNGGKSLKETPLPKQSNQPFHLYMLTLSLGLQILGIRCLRSLDRSLIAKESKQ